MALVAIAAFFLVCAFGAWRLRRIRTRGLLGHPHRQLRLGAWRLLWPQWWEEPRPSGPGHWEAATHDHDGRVQILELRGPEAASAPESFLRAFLARRDVAPDAWMLETAAGEHGAMHLVEGRAHIHARERAYVWLARVPGAGGGPALAIFYRASVLYGFADGVWLHEVASRARAAAAPSQP
ncbi:MAG: hypothetical protein EYC70_04515 [Planctomycetota bacterium]|nr:MAG: hypothetical protein EYC70_04515 [Planctomycetota bacterium]